MKHKKDFNFIKISHKFPKFSKFIDNYQKKIKKN